MSRKMTCPACDSHTSGIMSAFEDGQPCPYCGLPAVAAIEVLAAAQRGADVALQRRFMEAETRAAKAEAEVHRLGRKIEAVRRALEDDGDL